MKVLEILPMADWAGTARYMSDLVQGLTQRGNEVHLLTRDLPVTYRFEPLCKVFHWPLKRDSLSYKHIPKLCSLIKKYSYDVVHVHGGKDAWVVMLARLFSGVNFAVCSTRHDLNRDIHKDLFHKWMYQNMEASICISKTLQADYLSKNPFIQKEQAPLVYNGVDTNLFSFSEEKRLEKRAELGLQDEFAIGVFARICKQKGIHLALDAINVLQAKKNSNFHLFIFGTESGDDYCLQIRKRLNDENLNKCVTIAGFQEDVPAAMMAMDVVIAPAIERESFGLSVCEAMSLERAVIVTNLGGQGETVVHGESGMLVSPDAEAVAAALESLFRNQSLREAMGKQGRKRVCEFFSQSCMALETEKVLSKAIEKRHKIGLKE